MIYRVTAEGHDVTKEGKHWDKFKLEITLSRIGGVWAVGGLDIDVPFPKGKHHPKARFYFTEAGWRRSRKMILAQAKEQGKKVRVECRKNPKRSEIVYQDKWQVSLLPNKN